MMPSKSVIPTMMARLFATTVAVLTLCACAGPGPGLTGNDTGGIIPFASYSRPEAMKMATEHCARYGMAARGTGIDPRYGGYYSFSCDRDRHVRY